MYKALYFVGGLVIGAASGASIAHFLTKKAERSYAEREIDEMHGFYMEKRREYEEKLEQLGLMEMEIDDPVYVDEEDNAPTDSIFASQEEKPSLEEFARVREEGRNKVDYIAYSQNYKEEGPTEDSGEGENSAHPSAEPYAITDEQYVQECLSYEKREFRYYKEDKTLCNEEDEVLEPQYSVGERAINELVNRNRELVYVRNDILKIDYEVQAMEGSYNEQVLGHYEED